MADMRVSVVKAACAHVLGLDVVESMERSHIPLPTIMGRSCTARNAKERKNRFHDYCIRY